MKEIDSTLLGIKRGLSHTIYMRKTAWQMTLEKKILVLVVLTFLVAAAVFYALNPDPSAWLSFILQKDTHPVLFIVLLAVLPIFGFPISVLLLMTGVKFDMAVAFLAAGLVIPVHLTGSYLLATSVIRPLLGKSLNRWGHEVPKIPEDKVVFYTFLFVAIPGPPYVLKNYLLPLAGTPFRYFFVISWLVEFGLFVPFIGLGEAAGKMNLLLSLFFVAVLIGIYLFVRWLKGRFHHTGA